MWQEILLTAYTAYGHSDTADLSTFLAGIQNESYFLKKLRGREI
jgi:hypothetical protein